MKNDQDLIVIGGGIMGLMTAYYASLMGKRVTILEKLTIGNKRRSPSDKKAASFSLTRSIRSDYLDPEYSKLANKSRKLWKKLEKKSEEKFLIDCGCLNLANLDVTPNLDETYAAKSYANLKNIGLKVKKFSKLSLEQKFPQFSGDLGTLDVNGGFLFLPEITKSMLKLLKINKVQIVESINVNSIIKSPTQITVFTNKGNFTAKKLVITAGSWTNSVIKLIQGCKTQFPITLDKPKQCKYFIPKSNIYKFTPSKFPVFAYLDVGIYGHPMYLGKTKGVKISFYNPPDIEKIKNSKIQSVEDFVKVCIPSLKDAKIIDVRDADQCFYDMVKDKDFIIGSLPKFKRIFVGTGWNGTGYKFAPLVGKILSQLAIKGQTVYDIARFSPKRFKNYE